MTVQPAGKIVDAFGGELTMTDIVGDISDAEIVELIDERALIVSQILSVEGNNETHIPLSDTLIAHLKRAVEIESMDADEIEFLGDTILESLPTGAKPQVIGWHLTPILMHEEIRTFTKGQLYDFLLGRETLTAEDIYEIGHGLKVTGGHMKKQGYTFYTTDS